jgi:hypothetical protein
MGDLQRVVSIASLDLAGQPNTAPRRHGNVRFKDVMDETLSPIGSRSGR